MQDRKNVKSDSFFPMSIRTDAGIAGSAVVVHAARIDVMAAVTLFVLAFVCFGTNPASAAADKPLKKVSIQLQWDHQYQFAGYYAALWQGYYADAGFDVEIRSAVKQDGTILSATGEVADGKADYGVGAADILLARGQGKPLMVVASIYQQSAAAFYARADTPFSSPKDFLNLVVSRNVDDLIDIELQAMLKSEGIDIGKIRTIPQTTNLEDFINHVSDAFSGYIIAESYQLNQKGIPYKTLRPVNYGIDFYGDSLFTTAKTVNRDPAAVEQFRLATVKGWEYALEHPTEISDEISRILPRTADIVGGSFSGFNRFQIEGVKNLTLYPFVSVGNTNPNRWRRMSELMQDLAILKTPVDIGTFVFDYPGVLKAGKDKTIRALVSLLLMVIIFSLAGLLWIRIFVLRKQVRRKTIDLLTEKAALEKNQKELESANEGLVAKSKELREGEIRLIAAKEGAEAARVAQSQFLANMSHEIRTPINGFMGMLQLLEMTGMTEEQKNYIALSRRSSEALLVVINDILDYSKMEAGKMELASIPFSIKNVIEDVMSLFQLAASEKSLKVSYHNEDGVPDNLLGDPFRLRQILSNLVGNAIKFTPEGRIDVSALVLEKPAEQKIKLEFRVKDTGIGISEETVKDIFHRFSQVDNTNNRKFRGTGLGLAISKSLVELMSGDIRVESRVGEGSCFYFTCIFDLPDGNGGPAGQKTGHRNGKEPEATLTAKTALEPEATPTANKAALEPETVEPSRRNNLHLLLVEDDETSRIIFMEVSRRRGWKVTQAVNGREAVALYCSGRFDAILMDVQMPVMNGFEATDIIRRMEAPANCRIPIIAMTAKALSGDREMCLKAGMDDYLSKPIDTDAFCDMVERWTNTDAFCDRVERWTNTDSSD